MVTLPDAKRRQALCTAHRSKWASTVTYWAICASASNFADAGRARHGRHRTSPALHVTRKTRSRRLAVAPLHHGASRCTMEHHDATGVTTPRQTVKASPHRHKWMLSHGAPADPSDPWNSHAAPVSPRQNGQRAEPKHHSRVSGQTGATPRAMPAYPLGLITTTRFTPQGTRISFTP